MTGTCSARTLLRQQQPDALHRRISDDGLRLAPQLRQAHKETEAQFRSLYRTKYAPLKEEHARCAGEADRLRRARVVAAEEAERWRAQVRWNPPLTSAAIFAGTRPAPPDVLSTSEAWFQKIASQHRA